MAFTMEVISSLAVIADTLGPAAPPLLRAPITDQATVMSLEPLGSNRTFHRSLHPYPPQF